MAILTQAEFARQAGVTRQAVRAGILRKKLVVTEDRKIDTDEKLNRFYMHRNQSAKIVRNTTPFAHRKKQDGEQPAPSSSTSNGDYSDDLGTMTLEEAARVEKIERIIKLRVETAAKRGELIDREVVREAFMKFYAVHTGELHPLGDKIAQDLTAIFGDDDEEKATEVRKSVDGHVFKTLQHIKRLMDDFYQRRMEEEKNG